jgi:hypothetical protein
MRRNQPPGRPKRDVMVILKHHRKITGCEDVNWTVQEQTLVLAVFSL